MLRASVASQSGRGRLAENVLHFARLLRSAGLPVGTDRPLFALAALETVGLGSRADVRSVLQACLIDRIEHRALFEQAFEAFWRNPALRYDGSSAAALAREATAVQRPRGTVNRRLAEALWPGPHGVRLTPDSRAPERTGQIRPSGSDRERLRTIDFESMTGEEWTAAGQAVAALVPSLERIGSRRDAAALRGPRLDPRKLMREAARRGGEFTQLPRRRRLTRTEPLIALIDVSGSMSRYSRMFLQFAHMLLNRPIVHDARTARLRVAVFVFGTRLTAITRELAARDPDEALACVSRRVPDWSGGTRIGACLKEFNRTWTRRLPLARATVLLVTDGLERADCERLAHETARLKRSSRRLLWLNPLLRYDAFTPEARGVRAMLPHVDRLLPVHNIESLERLAVLLGETARQPRPIRAWN